MLLQRFGSIPLTLRAIALASALLAVAGCGSRPQSAPEESATAAQGAAPATEHAHRLIGPAGGNLAIPAVVSLEFPEDGFSSTRDVQVAVIQKAREKKLMLESTRLHGVTMALPYQIRINTGGEQPRKPVMVRVIIPEDFRDEVPADSWVRLFGYMSLEEGGIQMEMYEHCGGRFHPRDAVVSVPLLPPYFSNVRTGDDSYEAVLTLGISPPVHGAADDNS